MDRRKFCKTGLSTAIALGIPGYLAGCSKSNPVLPPSEGITARAAAITGDNLDAMIRDAIDALGGMNTIINKGDTVFIKPNFVTVPWANSNNCFHTGECTKPEIILAVTEECLKAGAGEVIIGEGSHLPSFDWKYALTLDGKTNLSIIDFSIGIEGDGPTRSNGGTTIDMKDHLGTWAIVASKDIMAADATAARIMNHHVNSISHLTMGFNMGLGEVREESIEILGEKLANLHVNWKAARMKG
jgi:uncharacterized protein (DUF362 family)